MEIVPTVSKLTHALLETKRGLYIAPERRRLASGLESCVYFNVGDEVISYPTVKPLVVAALADTYKYAVIEARKAGLIDWNYETDRLIGVPEGANMLTSSLGDNLRIGQNRVRENLGNHGDQRAIEGSFEPGMTVAFVEDVMSTGSSTIDRAIKPAEAAGLQPRFVIALIDRQYGGIPKMNSVGLVARAFMTTTDIAECLIKESLESDQPLITDQQIKLLQEELEELGQLT
jgi:orotate phosphoribosyltransferase